MLEDKSLLPITITTTTYYQQQTEIQIQASKAKEHFAIQFYTITND